jgi:hypothetical protein
MGIFDQLITADEMTPFVQDVAYATLNEGVVKPSPLKGNFTAMQFTEEERESLRGSMPEITLDARLAIIRGNDFNTKMAAIRGDGIYAHGSFIGTPNGHSARCSINLYLFI